MPFWDYSYPVRVVAARKNREKERRKKHDEIVRLWRAGQISWNEYCRQEKKYR